MSATWDETYSNKPISQRSWTEAIPHASLKLISAAALDPDGAIIDVGGGSARLVDELRRRRYSDVSVLDISQVALDEARSRLRDPAVTWIHGDVIEWSAPRHYQLWHDRAVFHFLTDAERQARYAAAASAAVAAGGHVVLGTFSPSGPDTCSGLPVRRWAADELAAHFADDFELRTSLEHDHLTPWGTVQPFTWVLLRRHDA